MNKNIDLMEDVAKIKEFAIKLNPPLEEIQNLDSYIRLTIRKIMNYCNIKRIPDELVEIASEMLIDNIAINKVDSDADAENSGEVKSITEGDTTVTFDYSSTSDYKKMLNKFFKDYKSQLAPFRKLRW